ncbi:hypothetical protein F2Q70_00017238 [Brassica cretica]|uniref:Uncharacterized protein n=1 Tax=Brassica cretica TaxID=69181 RepID=A0A8S9I5R8_BRACR|nr:hypothetical protein F2Q70_00017238 [Brassica cretica]
MAFNAEFSFLLANKKLSDFKSECKKLYWNETSSPLQKSFSRRLQPSESGGVRETGVDEHKLILTNDNDIRRVKS